MNTHEFSIIRELKRTNGQNLYDIFQFCKKQSIDADRVLRSLVHSNLLVSKKKFIFLTEKAENLLNEYKVDNAIILAAGMGMRFAPLSYDTPKGLIEVKGERLIERQIRQLHAVGIMDIIVVVGYKQEMFYYLTEKFGVQLVYSSEFKTKNNISSLYQVRHLLKNSYILVSDNYLKFNIFNTYESKSWYSATKAGGATLEWCLSLDEQDRIRKVEIGGFNQWHMYGPAYFTTSFSKQFVPLIDYSYKYLDSKKYYWEDVLKDNISCLEIYANKQPEDTVYEFETLEELRKFDSAYTEQSNNRVMATIAKVFNIEEAEITRIRPLKTGMTNRSFIFAINSRTYVCRVPGEGTDLLINRHDEYCSYQVATLLKITDNLIHFDPQNGIKISAYECDAQVPDLKKPIELRKCVYLLKQLHSSEVAVSHCFIIEDKINHYEDLCTSLDVKFDEVYYELKPKIEILLTKLKRIKVPQVFCHIDPIKDNFLILSSGEIKLIDWEYAAMGDPAIDIAMFAINNDLTEDLLDELMGYYYVTNPTIEEMLRVNIYISLGSFLWALWAQYKEALGESFGNYKTKMYQYAKDYYEICLQIRCKYKSCKSLTSQ